MQIRLAALLFVSLHVASTTGLRAQECDPSKFLIQDSAIRSIEVSKKLDQTATSKAVTQTSEGSSGNLNFANVLDLGGSQSSAFSQAIEKYFSLKWSSQYKSAEAYLQMSETGRKAYRDCIEGKTTHIFMYPAENVMESSDTSVRVRFEHALQVRPIKATISVDGAELAKDQKRVLSVEPGGTATIRIRRRLNAPFTVTVDAGNGSENLAVPAAAATKLVREVRYSPNAVFGHAVNRQVQTKDMCVDVALNDDAIIIPDSAVLVTPWRKITRGGVFSEIKRDAPYNPKRVCKQASAYDDGTNNVDIGVCAFTYAEVLVKIPRDKDHSDYKAPPYVGSNQHDVVCKETR
jgi:hypothetical protein